jgi:hypothetical protein
MAQTATPPRPSPSDRELDGTAVSVGWEYLIVALPTFAPARNAPGASDAVRRLNNEGRSGWEAVTMTALGDGTIAVLFKRPLSSP